MKPPTLNRPGENAVLRVRCSHPLTVEEEVVVIPVHAQEVSGQFPWLTKTHTKGQL